MLKATEARVIGSKNTACKTKYCTILFIIVIFFVVKMLFICLKLFDFGS